MKTLRNLTLATALAGGLSACAMTGDGASDPDYGFWLAVTAVGVDLANDAGVLIAEAGNISPAGMFQIEYTSDQVTAALEQCYNIFENVEAGFDVTFNVTGCVVTTLNALEGLFRLTDVEGSPFSGQSTAQVIGSLFAMVYPEAAALRDVYETAQAEDRALTAEEVRPFIQNAVGSNIRLGDAIDPPEL